MKNKGISDEERKLFRDAVRDVKPLKKTHIDEIKQSPVVPEKPMTDNAPIKKIKLTPQPYLPPEKISFQFSKKPHDVTGEEVIAFARTGLQHKHITALRQGKTKLDATLDLHEHTSDEAIQAVDRFLKRCFEKQYRFVCIIHGKGHLSFENKPVLKNLLNAFLRDHPLVIAFHSAKNKHGGTGALYVRLKAGNI